jgi:hypothetical protein
MFKGVHRQTDISQEVWGMKHRPLLYVRLNVAKTDRQTEWPVFHVFLV